VAQYRAHQGVLPLHFAAQLNIKGLVELVLSAYPQGACTSTEHRIYALPLHLACQSSKRVLHISHLLQEYPAAAQSKDWAAIEDGEEEDGDDQIENYSLEEDIVPSGYPLHHLCASRDFWASSADDASAKERLLIQMYQAHPEATASFDHTRHTSLSLLCENICSFHCMEAYNSQLNDQSGQSASSTEVDCQGRLHLHYLAEKVASAIVSCQHERQRLVAFDPSDLVRAWKCLVAAHPQPLFCKDHLEHTPMSLLLLMKKSDQLDMHTRGSGVMHIVLHASFDCCMPPPAEDVMAPSSHLLAFFADALYPAKQEFMHVLKKDVAQDASAVIDSQGNTILHIACLGLHWVSQDDNDESLHSISRINVDTDVVQRNDGKGMVASVHAFECFASQDTAVSNMISHEACMESSRHSVLDYFLSTGEQTLVQMPNHKGQLPLRILLNSGTMIAFTNTNTKVTQEAVKLLIRSHPESSSIPVLGLLRIPRYTPVPCIKDNAILALPDNVLTYVVLYIFS
jgi:ankyrin repeat protein